MSTMSAGHVSKKGSTKTRLRDAGISNVLGRLTIGAVAASAMFAVAFEPKTSERGAEGGFLTGRLLERTNTGTRKIDTYGTGLSEKISLKVPGRHHNEIGPYRPYGVCIRSYVPQRTGPWKSAWNAVTRAAQCSRRELEDRGLKTIGECSGFVTDGGCIVTARHCAKNLDAPNARVFAYFGPTCEADVPGFELSHFIASPDVPKKDLDFAVGKVSGGAFPGMYEPIAIAPPGSFDRLPPDAILKGEITGYGPSLEHGVFGSQRTGPTELTRDPRNPGRILFEQSNNLVELYGGDSGGVVTVKDQGSGRRVAIAIAQYPHTGPRLDQPVVHELLNAYGCYGTPPRRDMNSGCESGDTLQRSIGGASRNRQPLRVPTQPIRVPIRFP